MEKVSLQMLIELIWEAQQQIWFQLDWVLCLLLEEFLDYLELAQDYMQIFLEMDFSEAIQVRQDLMPEWIQFQCFLDQDLEFRLLKQLLKLQRNINELFKDFPSLVQLLQFHLLISLLKKGIFQFKNEEHQLVDLSEQQILLNQEVQESLPRKELLKILILTLKLQLKV